MNHWTNWRIGPLVLWSIVSAGVAAQPSAPESLRPAGGLPAHLCGQLREPVGFAQASDGRYLILDRRQHTVSIVDKARTTVTTLMRAGMEKGNVLQPAALSLAAGDVFAVSDAPFGAERVQMYYLSGALLSAFLVPGTVAPRLTMDGVILNSSGSMHFTGKRLLINRPESGDLIWVHDLVGKVTAQIGQLRKTGFEADRDVHLAMNVGLPIETPDGGVMFVFQTGIPMFRKYAADGRLEFERHIEGPALDAYVQAMPTTWPTRQAGDGTYPVVPPIVRAAAVSPQGELWVSLMPMVTYVYNAAGDKIRTVQFNATGPLAPSSLSFSRANGRLLVMPGCYEFEPAA
jgi:hypothetical protein